MPTEQTEQRTHGFSAKAQVIALDPEATEAAAELVDQFLAQREQGNALFEGEFREDVYKQAEALTKAIRTLVADYRFHRPTQWAYDAACAAIEKHRQRADKAEAELAALKATQPCGRSAVHPAHKHMTGRKVYQCAGVSNAED